MLQVSEAQFWKHNDLEFYTQVLQTIKEEKEELSQLAGNINAAIARASSISMSSAEQHEKRGALKRKQENKAKSGHKMQSGLVRNGQKI